VAFISTIHQRWWNINTKNKTQAKPHTPAGRSLLVHVVDPSVVLHELIVVRAESSLLVEAVGDALQHRYVSML